jgi:hypothetical protein
VQAPILAFGAFAGTNLRQVMLVDDAGNPASCRIAEKAGGPVRGTQPGRSAALAHRRARSPVPWRACPRALGAGEFDKAGCGQEPLVAGIVRLGRVTEWAVVEEPVDVR